MSVEPVFRDKDEALPQDEKRLVAVPGPVVELLQAEIDLHNAAMNRWNRKLRHAATLSGVPEDANYDFKQKQDGTFVFIVEDA